jgi:NAD(P)-dependent dehydrogenase (short-subunit alcohol dehydrogenase family)/acyl dehydratase/putative sterol carrier protein
MGVLDGKVVLVTGAGGGIGRSHAQACAREGARVVVNDLGGDRHGQGQGSTMADRVVEEIEAVGGEAVANYDSVTDFAGCERMVQTALEHWGRLDVVVNNAGILRDRTFAKMDPSEWDIVIAVHLTGTRNVVRAALDALKVNGGAIINTSSVSGLIGNFGQSNYGAAKAGIYGLTRVLSMELRKYGITANCIAPVAKTRMTEELDMISASLTPEHISPIVVYLASDHGKTVSGRVFGVEGQRLYLYEVKMNDGVEKQGEAPWSVAEIHEQYEAITAWETQKSETKADTDDVVSAVFKHFPAGHKQGAAPDWKATLHWVVSGGTDQTIVVNGDDCSVHHALVGSPTCTVKIGSDSLISLFKGEIDPAKLFMTGKASADNMADLMKLGMAFDFEQIAASFSGGAEKDTLAAPLNEAPASIEKRWPLGKRYDGGYWQVDAAEFQAYARATGDENPSYFGAEPVAPPMYHVRAFNDLMHSLATDPELEIDMLRLVHGEHAMRFHKLVRHGDIIQLRGELQGVDEKRSGRVFSYGLFGFVDGELAYEGQTKFFIRSTAAAQGSKKSAPKLVEPPPAPSFEVAQNVAVDQAVRYADASGDDNPIHTDESIAKSAGLPGCILHGLCTMALAQRDVIDGLAEGAPERLKYLAVRWAKPVFPGETLRLKVWEQGAGQYVFVTENPEGKAVIVNGRVEIA